MSCNSFFPHFLSISVFGTRDGGRRENGTQEKTVRSWPEVCRRGSSRWSGQTPNTARDFAKMSSLRRCLLSPPVYYLWTSERDQLGAHFSGKRRAPVLPPFLPVFGNIHCAAQPSRRLNTKLYLDQVMIVWECYAVEWYAKKQNNQAKFQSLKSVMELNHTTEWAFFKTYMW